MFVAKIMTKTKDSVGRDNIEMVGSAVTQQLLTVACSHLPYLHNCYLFVGDLSIFVNSSMSNLMHSIVLQCVVSRD